VNRTLARAGAVIAGLALSASGMLAVAGTASAATEDQGVNPVACSFADCANGAERAAAQVAPAGSSAHAGDTLLMVNVAMPATTFKAVKAGKFAKHARAAH
jgi:hypothetical protein